MVEKIPSDFRIGFRRYHEERRRDFAARVAGIGIGAIRKKELNHLGVPLEASICNAEVPRRNRYRRHLWGRSVGFYSVGHRI